MPLKTLGCRAQLVDVSLPKELRQQDENSILIELTVNTKLPQHLMAARTLSPVLSDWRALLQVMNISPTAVTIYEENKVGTIKLLSELFMVDANEQSSMSQSTPDVDFTESMSQFVPNVHFTESDFSAGQQQEFFTLLHQYKDLFAIKNRPQLWAHHLHRGPTHPSTSTPPATSPTRCYWRRCFSRELFNRVIAHGVHQ